MLKPEITLERAKQIGNELHVDWTQVDPEQFREGLLVELEHGARDNDTNITNNDSLMTGKIALAHLKEIPDYYRRLNKMEHKADRFWGRKKRSLDAKESYRKNVLLIRDEVAEWNNKIEAIEREIPALKEKLRLIDFSKMKKRFAKKAARISGVLSKSSEKISVLKEKMMAFEKRAEEEFSGGKERIRWRFVKEKGRVNRLLDVFFKYFDRVREEFHAFIEEVNKFSAQR